MSYELLLLNEDVATVRVKEDQIPDFEFQVRDSTTEQPIDLTDYTVYFSMRKSGQTTSKVSEQECTEIDATIGQFKYEFEVVDVNDYGTFEGEIKLENIAGKTLTIYDKFTITIRDNLD